MTRMGTARALRNLTATARSRARCEAAIQHRAGSRNAGLLADFIADVTVVGMQLLQLSGK